MPRRKPFHDWQIEQGTGHFKRGVTVKEAAELLKLTIQRAKELRRRLVRDGLVERVQSRRQLEPRAPREKLREKPKMPARLPVVERPEWMLPITRDQLTARR